jgi:hypothetical protein
MEVAQETGSLAEQAAKRRERILAHRRRRMALASGHGPEEVAVAAQRDQETSTRSSMTRAVWEEPHLSTEPRLAAASLSRDATPKQRTDLVRRFGLLWTSILSQLLLVTMAVASGIGAWIGVRNQTAAWLHSVPKPSAPLLFITLELSAAGSALLQRWMQDQRRGWISDCWWLVTRLRRWSIDAALFFFFFFATYLVLVTVENCFLRPAYP